MARLLTLTACRRNLMRLWGFGVLPALTLAISRSIVGGYKDRGDLKAAWEWLLPAIFPTLLLMVGVTLGNALQKRSNPSNDLPPSSGRRKSRTSDAPPSSRRKGGKSDAPPSSRRNGCARKTPEKADSAMVVPTFSFALAAGLSAAYLLIVNAIVLHTASSQTLRAMTDSSFYMPAFQGLVTTALGIFFASAERPR